MIPQIQSLRSIYTKEGWFPQKGWEAALNTKEVQRDLQAQIFISAISLALEISYGKDLIGDWIVS